MSDDEDEDTHFCLRCSSTITGLDAYVAHRKSKCRQQPADAFGPGPSGLQDMSISDERCHEDSPERPREDPEDNLLLQPASHKADDYFFSSLCLQSSSKTGEPAPSIKHHGVLTRSKISEKNLPIREDKPPLLPSDEAEAQVDSESEESDDGRHPPPTSGGKWLPGFRPSQRSTNVLWKSATPEHRPAEAENFRRPLAPPPSHTRGKWDSSERPWGPLRKPNAYWCGPCNRRLSSRVVYERHIKSELHFKRTNPWRTQTSLGKRNVKRTRIAQDSTLRVLNRRSREARGAKRRRGAVVCDVCNYRVAPHLMGKHLISHYHCKHPRNDETNNALVLKHMLSIVHQAPFQCGLCKFYCNTQQAFLAHWASEMHRQNDMERSGVYWCPNCNVEAESSLDMACHLVEDLHRDRVMIINHSVPVIIQKITPLQCDVCGKCFRYNVQLRAHSRVWGHEQTRGSASNSYQESMSCPDCPYKCNSLVSLQRHSFMKHRKTPYFCRRCGLSFKSIKEVKQHRNTTEHRDVVSQKCRRCPHCERSFFKLSSLKSHLEQAHPLLNHRCLKCGATFTLKQQLSQHASKCQILETTAKSDLEKCPILNRIDPVEAIPVKGQEEFRFTCDKCSFAGRTESEWLVHKFYHQGGETSAGKFLCPYCNKTYSESYLHKHMMTHTSERPHTCEICNYSFSRQQTLNRHMATIHQVALADFGSKYQCDSCHAEFTSEGTLDRHKETRHHDRLRKFKCSECNQGFFEKGTLDRHMQTHFGKKFRCSEPGCIFTGRSRSELNIHMRTHSSCREFKCQQCSYSSKTKNQLSKHVKTIHSRKDFLKCPKCQFCCQTGSHLKRHMRTHTGSKPYQCPHCSFSCTSLDNLRKHIICSKIHPGKKVYECRRDGCDFTTNLSKDFKSHLVLSHRLLMKDAMTLVAGIYKAAVDSIPKEGADDKVHEIGEPVPETEVESEVEDETMEEYVYSTDVVEAGEPLPTLASAALTPAKTDEDIIFIHIGGPDEQPYDPHLFHQTFPIIENFPGQSHYDTTEIETTPEENS